MHSVTQSIWEQHHLAERIRNILQDVPTQHGHHLGRPFLSGYQIAMHFREQHREAFDAIGMPLGGAGTGEHSSFAQYVSGQLSRRINDRRPDVEGITGGLLSDWKLHELSYKYEGEIVTSSLVGAWDMAIFRLETQ